MKKILSYFVFLTILMISFNVKALEVSKTELTLKPGESDTIELYVNTEAEITSVTFTFVFKSYDIPASFTPAEGISDSGSGITHTLTLTEPKSGHILLGTINTNVVASPTIKSSTTNISNVTAKTNDSEESIINLTGVTITTNIDLPEPTPEEIAAKAREEEERARKEAEARAKAEAEEKARKEAEEKDKAEEANNEQIVVDTNLLSAIASNIVTIELIPNQYSYSVTINKNVEELDLKGIAKTPDTEVTTSNQKISELEDNKIIITAKTSDAEQEYIINVNIKEEIKEEVKPNNSYKTKWIIISLFMIISLGVILLFLKNK